MADLPKGIPVPKPRYPDDNVIEADEVPVPPFLLDNVNISTDLDGLEKDVLEAANEIYSWVEFKLSEMESELLPIQMEYRGQVDLMLDEMSERITKVAGPIIKWIDAKMDEMYQHAADGGIPTMSNEGFVMAKGDETGYVLPYNYVRMYGDGKPFTVNWPTELLGPDPFAGSTYNDALEHPRSQGTQGIAGSVSQISLAGSNQLALAGEGLPVVDNEGGGQGACPPGMIPAILPDGTLECNPPEYAYTPPITNPPPFTPPNGNGTPPPNGPPPPTPPPTGSIWEGKVFCDGQWYLWRYMDANGLRLITLDPSMYPNDARLGWAWLENPSIRGEFVNESTTGGRQVRRCQFGGGPPIPPPYIPPPPPTPPDTPPPIDSCPNVGVRPPDQPVCSSKEIYDCAKELWDKFRERRERRYVPTYLLPFLHPDWPFYQQPDADERRKNGLWHAMVAYCEGKQLVELEDNTERGTCDGFNVKPINWCKENVSSDINAFMFGLPSSSEAFAKELCVYRMASGRWYHNSITSWMYDASLIPQWIPDSINSVMHTILTAVWGIVESLSDPANPKSKPSLVADGITSLMEALNSYTGFPPMSWIRRMRYTANAMNPVEIPSPAEVGGLWQSGMIDESTFANLMGAHDLCVDWQKKVMDANRTRPDAFQNIDAWRRGIIGESVRDLRLRQLGVTNDADRDILIRLSEAMPGMSDLISFMVKDAFDTELVKEWKLDDEFDQKWTGEAQRLGNAQGISRDTALIYWLAHWQNISPTQLYQMVGRLRPGRVPKNIEVTRETALRVLGINDYVPYWRERLLAIAEHPLNLSDLQQAYYTGTLTDQEFRDGLLDLLYNPRDIDILLRRYAREKLRRQRFAAGLPTPKELISSYIDGFIGAEELIDQLGEYDWEPERIQDAIAGADRKRKQNVRKAVVRSVKKRYIRRRLDRAEAIGELIVAGLAVDSVAHLVRLWEAERSTTERYIPAQQLCTLWSRAIINNDEYVDGLSRLGYSPDSIRDVTALCGLKREDARIKDVERKLKEQEARAEKARKAIEKQMKDMKKEQDKIDAKKLACVPKKKRCEALGVPIEDPKDAKKETNGKPEA